MILDENLSKVRKNRGITLVEVLVVTAMLAILTTPIFNLFIVNNAIVNGRTERVEAKDGTLIVQDYIYQAVKLAQSVRFQTSIPGSLATGEQCIYYDTTKGLIHETASIGIITDNEIVVSKSFLGDYNIKLNFSGSGEIINIGVNAVSISGVPTTIYEASTKVKAANILRISQHITSSPGNCIIFKEP